ncbi:MAG: ATP-binding cassette domain-containing protein [Anaerolineaceae bacterium]|nr:ATP-binding cassette domain-containing protein [Anaerolineaceae bacterium]
MTAIISVRDLRKTFRVLVRRPGLGGSIANLFAPHYRSVQAVEGVSFSLQAGELVGYLGPNGAGKSTTIKVLTGLLVPTGGEVRVDGQVPWEKRERYVKGIGVVFGNRPTLWWDLPVIDSLELLQPMYDIPAERFRYNLVEFKRMLELDEFINTPVRSLSLGQRMRADLCAALLHEPKLLFLDEPTIGLDVVAKEQIRRFVLDINHRRGVTVLLTTHDLTDVERLCERVMILDHGKLLYDGTLAALNGRFESAWTLKVDFEEEYPDVSVAGLPAPQRVGRQALYLFNHRELNTAELVQQLMARFQVVDLEVRRPPLEETIRRIYAEQLLTK